MTKEKSQLIDSFYSISELLEDDLEMVCSFIKKNCNPRIRCGLLKKYIEDANYEKLDKEIDIALSYKLEDFREFVISQKEKGTQTSIFDYMKE